MSPTTAETPLVSVVMPVYNGERFLAAAVESILSQTFADFEFIIVDDGSADGTIEILTEYAQQDARLRVIRQPSNGGVTAALNQGVRLSRGAYIARMDADDISLPHRFQRQVRYLESHPDIAVVGSWFYSIDENGRRAGIHYYPIQPALVAWSMLFYNSLAHPTVMMRRDAVDVAAAYRANYRHAEDYELFMRLSQSRRLSNIPEGLLLYRTWSGNVSKRAGDAERVLLDCAAVLGIPITEEEAAALQGLSRDRYPADPETIRRLADLIKECRAVYIDRIARDHVDVGAINADAALRTWQLAGLAARRSPRLALTLAASAIHTRPAAILPFASKVAGRFKSILLRPVGKA